MSGQLGLGPALLHATGVTGCCWFDQVPVLGTLDSRCTDRLLAVPRCECSSSAEATACRWRMPVFPGELARLKCKTDCHCHAWQRSQQHRSMAYLLWLALRLSAVPSWSDCCLLLGCLAAALPGFTVQAAHAHLHNLRVALQVSGATAPLSSLLCAAPPSLQAQLQLCHSYLAAGWPQQNPPRPPHCHALEHRLHCPHRSAQQ